jgi:hypothetical protein
VDTPGPEAADAVQAVGTGAAAVVLLAGLSAAMVVSLTLRPSADGQLSWWKVLAEASVWVLGTAAAGTIAMAVAEAWLHQRRGRFLDSLEAAAAWLLLPPLVLLAGRDSAWALVFAAGVAGVVGACLRGMVPAAPLFDEDEAGSGPLFAELPRPDSGRGQAFAVAVCFECAMVLAFRKQLLPAVLLTALASFVFVWKRLTMLLRARGQTMARRSARWSARTAAAAVLALLIVLPPLLMKLVQMGPGGAGAAVQAAEARKDARDRDAANDAYRGIILFAVHRKEVLTPPVESNPLASGGRKPLIIPFDGAYWYFQAPRQGPGTHAHVAQGDPVSVSIFSKGWIPLAMQAHQMLGQPVELRCCGSMEVTVRNGDNRRGRIEMGVLLTDSSLPGKPSVFLGAQPIVSTEEDHFAFKPVPVEEELTFAIPRHAAVRKFDEITVVYFPAEARATLGARVGIEQFELEPR